MLAAAASVTAVTAVAGEPKPKAKVAQVARGKYIVEQVAMCGDCHAPRDEKGQHIKEKWLHGAPIDFKATVPMPRWAELAPPIAGLPGWTDAEAVALLTTGKDPKGELPDPPMPPYRLTREDATAVVAYLRSLPAPGGK